MRALTAFTMLCVLGASVEARVAPLASQAAVIASDDWVSNRSAAQREAEYFRAPQSPPLAERNYPCRLQLRIFEKTRLAQSCQ